MDVGIDTARSRNAPLTGHDLGSGANHDLDAGLDVGVAGSSNPQDAPLFDSDVRLDDAPVVENHGVGDHGVCNPSAGELALSHAITNDFSTSELRLLAEDGGVDL